jgi:hypothetical protein
VWPQDVVLSITMQWYCFARAQCARRRTAPRDANRINLIVSTNLVSMRRVFLNQLHASSSFLSCYRRALSLGVPTVGVHVELDLRFDSEIRKEKNGGVNVIIIL